MDAGTSRKEDMVYKMIENSPENLKEAVNIVMNSWLETIEINNEMINFIKKLKEENYNTYILSNAPLEIPPFVKVNNLDKLFNGMVFSAVEKKVKPNDDIYKLIINRYNLNPKESLFIDDKSDNIEAAKKNNINGYVFDYKKYENFKFDIKNIYNINI